ncbi:MAG TPA: cytochrome c3 family protein [Longimicrobiales bacterium]|nr:cytochrome c3 family protein [Longimicrobiales bacterium]
MSPSRRGPLPWRSAAITIALLAVVGIGALAQAPQRAQLVPAPAAPQQRTATQQRTPVPQRATPAQRAADAGCDRCHGELELLRQQAGGLTRAQELMVPAHVVAGSAHADLTCANCHTGVARYPHTITATSTRTCASCHEEADSLWRQGMHATADEPVACVQCHTVHAVERADSTGVGAHVRTMNTTCASCHETSRLPSHSPHADTVSCASCHGPHENRDTDDPLGRLAPANQLRTCGACHDTVASIWRTDIHGDAALRNKHLAGDEPVADDVSCTSCHTGHTMNSVAAEGFALESVERCAECHEKAASTFFGSYHGKATALGSMVAASCADCHGAHGILPDSMAASHVSDARVIETCRECHEHANAGFVKYDSHPDPFNRARNPWLFYSFFGMNFLLVGVLVVFGGHTIMWWIRLWLDKRRGIVHGPGNGHGGEA